MTSRFILDEFDLDLLSTSPFVRFRLFLLLVLIAATLDSVLVIDKSVFSDGEWVWCACGSSRAAVSVCMSGVRWRLRIVGEGIRILCDGSWRQRGYHAMLCDVMRC